MEKLKLIQTVINDSIYTLEKLIPVNVNIHSPSLLTEPYSQKEMGVLIGLLGEKQGKIFIDSHSSTFSALGLQMFGMPLEGQYLESFTGEFGNLFAGQLCIKLSQSSLIYDVTTPTVLVGQNQFHEFQQAFKLPATIQNIGDINILIKIDHK